MRNQSNNPFELEQLKIKFDEWRRTRTKKVLSEALWEDAVKLSHKYGVSRVSKLAKLSFAVLKKRTGENHQSSFSRAKSPSVVIHSSRAISKPAKSTSLTKSGFVEFPSFSRTDGLRQQGSVQVRIYCGFDKSLEIQLSSPGATEWANLISGLMRAEKGSTEELS